MFCRGVVSTVLFAVVAWNGSPAAARDVTIGVEAIDYLPAYGVRDGAFIGAAREIFDAFAAARGHRLTYKPLPVKRLYAELARGGIDLKFPDSPEWAPSLRQGHVPAFSRPVIAYVDGTLIRREAVEAGPGRIRSLGTIAGFTPSAWATYLDGGRVTLKENANLEQLLRQVKAERIDAAYCNVAVALYTAEQAGLADEVVYAPALPRMEGGYHLSSLSAPELVAEFDGWLAANGPLVAEIIARTGAEKGVR